MANIILNNNPLNFSDRKLELYSKYAEIIRWGRRYPIRFAERFYGLEFMDYQKYAFLNSWVASNICWLMSRSGSKSTLGAIFIMEKANLFPNHQTYILSSVGSQAKETFLKIEKIAKKEIASFLGLTDFFLGEIESSRDNYDGFVHDVSSFNVKLRNGSRINSLNGVIDNNRGKRANLLFYEEAGYINEQTYEVSKPFLAQDANFRLGGTDADKLNSFAVPNQTLAVSSASDTSTYFYNSLYKNYAKKMFMGDTDYFVADINCEVIFNATVNGKIYPVSLIPRDKVQANLETNKEWTLREYYNQFSIDGGEQQPFKRTVIRRNSEDKLLPELSNTDNNSFIFAYDPARTTDNSIVMVGKIINDPKKGYILEICNAVCFTDVNTKNKTPMSYPKQREHLQKMFIKYNGSAKVDYENIAKVLIDSGSGGGGRAVADELIADWTDEYQVKHRGIGDFIEQKEQVEHFPNALDKVCLISPTKYKTEMFDALVEMLDLDLIKFTKEYDGKDYLLLFNDTDEQIEYIDEQGYITNGKKCDVNEYKLDKEEQMALVQIDLAKEELCNIYRYDLSNGNYRYDKANGIGNLHDDRAYCLAMLGWYLKRLRKGQFIEQKGNKIDGSKYAQGLAKINKRPVMY